MLFVGVLILSLRIVCAQQLQTNAQHSKFTPPIYSELPLGAIKPQGWLLHQLQIMRDGTTGHLDEEYNKLKNNNGWLGGQGDGWEETPYWLDGAVPLAYLLNDTTLKNKVLRYINWTIDHQRPSGYFGPITKAERERGVQIEPGNCDEGEDWWPKMLMLKVIRQYYTATDDSRVIPFLTKYFHYQLEALKKCPLQQWTEWAESRGSEDILAAQWLYQRTHDQSLLALADLIDQQAFAWSDSLGSRDWVIHAAAYQNQKDWMYRHGVNVSMALKAPALNYQRTHDEKYLDDLRIGFHDLMTLDGLPSGVFSADEDLHGNDPTQGTELCAVVETMFSLEQIIAITGDVRYMDALERIAYNALPTQTTDDYNAKQYFQIANQVQVKKGVFNFSLPFDREMNNVFGMRSGYTCCLANMHQGWTKYTTHLWYSTAEGLVAVEYAPCTITAPVGRHYAPVTIDEETTYPFDDEVRLRISTTKQVTFQLQLRIPGWCSEAIISINGREIQRQPGGEMANLERTWQPGDEVTLKLPQRVTVSTWGRNSRAIERGPLVYALKLKEDWEKGTDEKEGDYYSVYPKDLWNYGLLDKVVAHPDSIAQVRKIDSAGSDFVWNLAHAPLEITVPAKKIPGWKTVNDVAPEPVTDRDGLFRGEVSDSVEDVTLVPYGCTKVRVVAFPVVH